MTLKGRLAYALQLRGIQILTVRPFQLCLRLCIALTLSGWS